MAIKRLWMSGQSNQVDANQVFGSFTDVMTNIMLPLLQLYIDPAQAEVTVSKWYSGIAPNATAIGGNGLAFENLAMNLVGSYYEGPSQLQFVKPAAPYSAEWPNFASWPFAGAGTNILTYASGLSAGTKGEIAAILDLHTEYDTRGTGLNTNWQGDDPRVLERARRRYFTQLRANLGKTAAECPIFSIVPCAYGPATNIGFERIGRSFEPLRRDAAFNLYYVMEQGQDVVWDSDTGGGTYDFHGTDTDLTLYARRIARGLARILGPLWAPASYGRQYAGNGPKLVWAQLTSDTNVRMTMMHDGGNDFTLPASPTVGWQAIWGARTDTPTAVTKVNSKQIDLTIPNARPRAEMLQIGYGCANNRLNVNGGIYDNVDTFDPKALPVGVTGASRIKGALRRTQIPLQVSASPPPFTF